jgi:hypothetical protein
MDVKISEIIALAVVMLYSIATVLPDIWKTITGKSKTAEKN